MKSWWRRFSKRIGLSGRPEPDAAVPRSDDDPTTDDDAVTALVVDDGSAAHPAAAGERSVTLPGGVDELGFAVGGRSRRLSPLNRPVLHALLWAAALSLVAAVMGLVAGGTSLTSVLVQALLLAGAFFAMVRFCLADSWGRRFWWFWLAPGLIMLLVAGSGPAGRWTLFGLGIVFLLGRRYRPLRHLTSAQRAGAFVLAFASALLLAMRPGWELAEDVAAPLGIIVNLGRAAGDLLWVFWLLILVHLVFGMRLHFLRLRPKLAVSGILIGLVPLALVLLLGLIVLYAALGGSRANRARDVLVDWSVLAGEGVDLHGPVFAEAFVWQPGAAAAAETPDWAADVWRGFALASEAHADAHPATTDSTGQDENEVVDVRTRGGVHFTFDDNDEDRGPWAPADTTAYFQIGGDLWLLDIRGLEGDGPRLAGWQLGERALHRLSRIVSADVGLVMEGDGTFDTEQGVLQGRLREREEDANFWQRPLYCGGALLDLLRFNTDRFPRDEALLTMQVSLADLGGEFVSGGSNLNVAVVVVLGILAGLFLLIEAAAAFFGFRITGGIIGAVNELHRGTKRLAQGDLSTRIEIPNEDEFGDLAHSFNEMTAAVERGRQVAVARERLLREMETARDIQRRLLPREGPGLSGFEVAGTSVPSRQVGGDYYDFLDLGDGRVGVAVGDVSGKGMPAALLMSNLQASLQGQVIHPATVADVVGRVNDLLVQSTDPHMFATFFYGVLDTRQSLFTSTNAGHNPPILQRADGSVEELGIGGLIIGMLPEQSYKQQTVTLEPNDVIVLYTDGITEAVARPAAGNGEGEEAELGGDEVPGSAAEMAAAEAEELPEDPTVMFGEGALYEVVRRSAHLPAEGIKTAILDAVARHTADAPQSDDITLVVIKRTGA